MMAVKLLLVNSLSNKLSRNNKFKSPDKTAQIKYWNFIAMKKQYIVFKIQRARNVSLVYPNTRSIPSDSIPLQDNTVNVIFLLSAVHEMRSTKERVRFLEECYRICKPDGKVVMVEHLRDFPNFLAFSVGFTHFFSRSTWKRAFEAAGFSSVKETKFTPFMSIF